MSLKALLEGAWLGSEGLGEARGATSWPMGARVALGLPPRPVSCLRSPETPLLGRALPGPSAVPWGHLRVSSHDPTFGREPTWQKGRPSVHSSFHVI